MWYCIFGIPKRKVHKMCTINVVTRGTTQVHMFAMQGSEVYFPVLINDEVVIICAVCHPSILHPSPASRRSRTPKPCKETDQYSHIRSEQHCPHQSFQRRFAKISQSARRSLPPYQSPGINPRKVGVKLGC